MQEWDGTFEGAVKELDAAVKAYKAGGTRQYALENAVESWSKIVCNHPDYIAFVGKQLKIWDDNQANANELALKHMREVLPREIVLAKWMTRSKVLEKYGLARPLAERFWRKKVLWLIWMQPEEIRRLHAHELDTQYWYWGLDIVEQRAVYAVLPQQFDNDFDGKKKQWLEIFKEKLTEMTTLEAASKLDGCRRRHPAYVKEESKHVDMLLHFLRRCDLANANVKHILELDAASKEQSPLSDKGWRESMYDDLTIQFGKVSNRARVSLLQIWYLCTTKKQLLAGSAADVADVAEFASHLCQAP